MWVDSRWLTLSNKLCSWSEDGAAGHRHELPRLPLRRSNRNPHENNTTKIQTSKPVVRAVAERRVPRAGSGTMQTTLGLGKAPAGPIEQGLLARTPQRATRLFCLIVGQPSLIPAETDGGGSNGPPGQNAQLSASVKSITTRLHLNHQASLYRLS